MWHPLSSGDPPAWATEWGEDRFGIFAGFAVGEARMRLRWIPPGSFVMGSPEDEPGSWDDERQHEVVLTQGYWLGETPLTQAVWEAVFGKDENPSEFRHPQRPVDNVSWDDVHERFLPAINERVPGLELRFPTEAEWEFACRAGTENATYSGAIEILGENDAPVLDAIAWYGGNSGLAFDLAEGWDASVWPEKQHEFVRAGTRVVGAKLPNGFGLYDMLGNVLEWCLDCYGEYPEGRVVDPRVDGGRSDRVQRGGSWFSGARSVRSAYRLRDSSFDSDPNYGFRPARS